jgi:hypothetical protein
MNKRRKEQLISKEYKTVSNYKSMLKEIYCFKNTCFKSTYFVQFEKIKGELFLREENCCIVFKCTYKRMIDSIITPLKIISDTILNDKYLKNFTLSISKNIDEEATSEGIKELHILCEKIKWHNIFLPTDSLSHDDDFDDFKESNRDVCIEFDDDFNNLFFNLWNYGIRNRNRV